MERRTLTELPGVSLSGVWDGSYFSDLETWYADTYPLREGMISLNSSLESLYGIRTTTLISDETADEIPEGEVDLAALARQSHETLPEEAESDTGGLLPDGEAKLPEEEQPKETVEIPDVEEQELTEISGSIYATSNAAYGVYYFYASGAARYALAVSALADSLEGIATVYDLLAPVSGCIMLNESTWTAIGCSDASDAISFMYTNMSSNVHTVDVVENLLTHRDEYIYFRTDHHWTALGAYYAYQVFCAEKGVTPGSLTDFDTMTFDGFLGTFYSSVSSSVNLTADTVTAYLPNGTNTCTTYMSSGGSYEKYTWCVVNDMSGYSVYNLYSTFAAGDQPFSYAHNETITDGSAILVVKDSYGNAFIPFLIDHYEYVYWIDFRYYSAFAGWMGLESDSISYLVLLYGIQDVLVLNNLSSSCSTSLLPYMEAIFK